MRKNNFIKLAVLFVIVISINACGELGDLNEIWKKAFADNHNSFSATTLTANTWADGNLTSSNNYVQWFKFTATASTQYIHASFGTLSELYVKVYDSSGNKVASESLYSHFRYISLTVTSGQEYYIKVTHSSDTYQIAFNATIAPPNTTTLTVNTWADGNITSSNGEQWFKFTATASTQYIHASFDTLSSLYVQVYDSSFNKVGDQSSISKSYYNKYISITVISGQMYYIKVTPYDYSYIGTYRIAFNESPIPPGTVITTLTANTWADGNLPEYGEQWFKFTATASTQYIHFSFSTLNALSVQVYDSSGNTVGSQSSLSSSSSDRYVSRTVTSGQEYYIKVTPYSSYYSGTYQIAFNTSSTPPS